MSCRRCAWSGGLEPGEELVSLVETGCQLEVSSEAGDLVLRRGRPTKATEPRLSSRPKTGRAVAMDADAADASAVLSLQCAEMGREAVLESFD